MTDLDLPRRWHKSYAQQTPVLLRKSATTPGGVEPAILVYPGADLTQIYTVRSRDGKAVDGGGSGVYR